MTHKNDFKVQFLEFMSQVLLRHGHTPSFTNRPLTLEFATIAELNTGLLDHTACLS